MLVLASRSPRRQALMTRITPDFTVCPAAIDERALPVLPPAEYVQALALAKGAAVAQTHSNATVVAADTMVVWQGTLLGKPADQAAAAQMLHQLSGQTHQVMTGLAVYFPNGQTRHTVVTTDVLFWPLTEAVIGAYLALASIKIKPEPMASKAKGRFWSKRSKAITTMWWACRSAPWRGCLKSRPLTPKRLPKPGFYQL